MPREFETFTPTPSRLVDQGNELLTDQPTWPGYSASGLSGVTTGSAVEQVHRLAGPLDDRQGVRQPVGDIAELAAAIAEEPRTGRRPRVEHRPAPDPPADVIDGVGFALGPGPRKDLDPGHGVVSRSGRRNSDAAPESGPAADRSPRA